MRYLLVLLTSLMLSACSNSGQIQQSSSQLLISEEDFSYKTIFLSKSSPRSYGIFWDEDITRFHVQKTLMEKGYNIAPHATQLAEVKAKSKGQSLLIECTDTKTGAGINTPSIFVYGIFCGGFDLYDGTKVFHGETFSRSNFGTEFNTMTLQNINVSLTGLPIAQQGMGRILSESEVFNISENR